MPNEFVARKGLQSLRSSSFEETVWISGSLSSPVEAYLTASWANHSSTSSYLNPTTDGRFANTIFHEHWLCNSAIGNSQWEVIISGQGATGSISGSEPKHPGIVELHTGYSNSNSIILQSGGNVITFDTGSVYTLDTMINIPILANATEMYQFFIGFGNNIYTGDLIDGAYLCYDYWTNTTNFLVKTANNSTRTTTDTGVAVVANIWYQFTVSVDGANAKFYINKTLVATHTTNIPLTRSTGLLIKLNKYAGYSDRTVKIDYFNVFMPKI